MTITEFLSARLNEDRELQHFDIREVEAKRRIISAHYPVDPCDAHDASLKSVPCETLCALALVYSDHPDYDPEWCND